MSLIFHFCDSCYWKVQCKLQYVNWNGHEMYKHVHENIPHMRKLKMQKKLDAFSFQFPLRVTKDLYLPFPHIFFRKAFQNFWHWIDAYVHFKVDYLPNFLSMKNEKDDPAGHENRKISKISIRGSMSIFRVWPHRDFVLKLETSVGSFIEICHSFKIDTV